MSGEIAYKGDKAPIQAGQRWHVERTNSWHNGFNRLPRCYERKEDVIDAFFDLAATIIAVRSMTRQSWTLYRWHSRPEVQPTCNARSGMREAMINHQFQIMGGRIRESRARGAVRH